jgi:hypothetical protein
MVGPGGVPISSNFSSLVCPTGSKLPFGDKREFSMSSNLPSATSIRHPLPRNFRNQHEPTTRLHDVRSKSYDRWTYMPDKRAAMAKWDNFVTGLLDARQLTVAA